ncbi:MAG: class II aldolase/adducin family protein [Gammaproteobacteria bacterium]|nr:class II aldolase/adducin family protein [Gammaproteobacteria bacterium]
MSDTVNEQILREELVEHYRLVAERGLNELSSGNLSVRFGDDRMLISPTGAASESITTDSIVNISLDGDWDGGRKPSSEWRMHAAIYERHAGAEAVVHTHSDYCVAVASHLKPLPGFHYLVGSFGGNDVPCVPYSTFGTQALADHAAEALTHRTACLLGKHGMICRAPNLKRAVNQAHRLEIMCRQYILARQLGEPERLTDTEWEEFFERARQNQYGKEI